ncbi:MAG: acyl-CoA thioesterase [Solirubrobacterales bacterium]
MRVRYSECDPQNVVFNANYLSYFDIAITELWREAIGPYEEAMAEHGVDLVVAEATVRYRAPLRFDEEFELVAEVAHLGTTSMVTAISTERDGTVCADGELRHVFVRFGTSEKTPIPDAVRTALAPFGKSAAASSG